MSDIRDQMSQLIFGRKRSECLEEEICVCCGEDAKEFNDPLSEKEYEITALCQECQDKVFDEEE